MQANSIPTKTKTDVKLSYKNRLVLELKSFRTHKVAIWVSSDGLVVKRHWNVWSQTWYWGCCVAIHCTDSGKLHVYTRGVRTSMARCIALAWLPILPEDSLYRRVTVTDVIKPITAQNLEWAPDPLLNKKTLYVPHTYLKTLRSSAYVLRSQNLSPRVARTSTLLHDGRSVAFIARRLNVTLNTAWSYVYEATRQELWEYSEKIIASCLWRAICTLDAIAHPCLGGPLRTLMGILDIQLKNVRKWNHTLCQYGELRYARLLLEMQIGET